MDEGVSFSNCLNSSYRHYPSLAATECQCDTQGWYQGVPTVPVAQQYINTGRRWLLLRRLQCIQVASQKTCNTWGVQTGKRPVNKPQ
jgi:hypothetical protein